MISYEQDLLDAKHNDNIYCRCKYEWKDNLKKLGFKWKAEIKKWYIPVDKFTKELYEKTQVTKFINYTSPRGTWMGTCYKYVFYFLSQEEKEILDNYKDETQTE